MRRFSLVLAVLIGCGSSSGGTGGAGGTGGTPGGGTGGGGTGGTGGAAGKTDMEWCQQACNKLTSCGVLYDATCASNCLLTPVFLACAKASAQECNPLALCAFKQAGATFCGGEAAGTPSAGGTCKGAADCEGACTAGGQPVSCGCKCWTALDPSKALNLLVNDECANARCKAECAPTGSGAACLSCFAARCPSEAAQCQGS
jgi:hypothetical protein